MEGTGDNRELDGADVRLINQSPVGEPPVGENDGLAPQCDDVDRYGDQLEITGVFAPAVETPPDAKPVETRDDWTDPTDAGRDPRSSDSESAEGDAALVHFANDSPNHQATGPNGDLSTVETQHWQGDDSSDDRCVHPEPKDDSVEAPRIDDFDVVEESDASPLPPIESLPVIKRAARVRPDPSLEAVATASLVADVIRSIQVNTAADPQNPRPVLASPAATVEDPTQPPIRMVPRREASTSVEIASAVPKATVPRKVQAVAAASNQQEEALRRILRDNNRSQQIVHLHRRITTLMQPPGSCAVISVQRDPHVAELLGCLAILHALKRKERVLLIDANMEQLCITESFGLAGAMGLGDVCEGTCHSNVAVHRTSTEALFVLPIGTIHNHRLDANTTLEVMAKLRPQFNLILVDAGHAQAESAVTMARACDRLLLQVQLGKTMRASAKKAVDLLFNSDLTASGVIITNADAKCTR